MIVTVNLNVFLLLGNALLVSDAFVPAVPLFGFRSKQTILLEKETETHEIDQRTGKRTGNSFLSEEARIRGAGGNPIEKIKQEKDATSAFVDIYEYAAKIREGLMTWEEVEKADLDTVSPGS
jgi:hypothetical protein